MEKLLKTEIFYIYSIYLLVFFIPSGFYIASGPVIGLSLLLWFLSKQYKNFILNINYNNILLPVFFVSYILVLVKTNNINNGISQITMHSSFLLLPVLFSSNLITKSIEKRILLIFVYSTLLFISLAYLYAVIDIMQTDSHIIRIKLADYNKFTSYGLTRVFSGYHPTFVSLFLNFSLLLLLKNQFNLSKWKSNFLIIYVLMSVFLLGSAIGMLSSTLILFIWSLQKIKNYYKRLLIILFFVLFGIFNYVVNPLNISKIEKFKKTKLEITDVKEKRNILTLRLVKWKSSLNIFNDNIMFGISPGDLKDELVKEYKKNDYKYAYLHKFGPHNQYIQVLTAFGIFGFIVFIAMLFLPYYLGNNSLYGWFIVIISLYFLTDDILERQQGLVFFSFFYALFNNSNKNEK